jgi:hypothetical protein
MAKNLYDYGLSLENWYGRNTIGNTSPDHPHDNMRYRRYWDQDSCRTDRYRR